VPPSALDTPTPCGDWDLRTLLNHTILWTSYSAERRAHGESVAEELMNKDFTADPGFREDYARQIGKAVTAWSAPQAWEGNLNVMGDATPAADVGAMLLMETALHGWDVARATGQEFRTDEQTATALEDIVQARPNSSASTRASPTPSNHRRTRRSSSAPSPCPAATPAGSRRHNDAVSTRTGEPLANATMSSAASP